MKLGVKTNYFFKPQSKVESLLTLNASTELASNFTDSTFHRSKFFARLVQNIDENRMQLELGLAGGLTLNKSAAPLKVNDMFYLKNFKGIRNIGYHYDSQGKGINGENLGFDRYLAASCKLNFLKAALF